MVVNRQQPLGLIKVLLLISALQQQLGLLFWGQKLEG